MLHLYKNNILLEFIFLLIPALSLSLSLSLSKNKLHSLSDGLEKSGMTLG